MNYDIGDVAKLTVVFADANGVPTNPTTVVLTVLAPDNSTSTPSATNTSTGTYQYNLSLTLAGVYYYSWQGTGTITAVEQGYVTVSASQLVTQPPESQTAGQVISTALRLCGIMLAPERGAAPEELVEGLRVLNSMIDAWKIERLTVWAIKRTTFTIIVNQQQYTVGTNGTPSVPLDRPSAFDSVNLVFTAFTPPLERSMYQLTDEQWEAKAIKGLTSTFPTEFYYQPTVPNGTLYLWPVPTAVNDVALYTWDRLQRVATLGTLMVMPPGYQEAIEYNLALKLAARYPTRAKLSPQVEKDAALTKGNLKIMNYPDQRIIDDFSARRTGMRYDIFSDSYRRVGGQ